MAAWKTGAGAGRRKLRRAEACRTDACDLSSSGSNWLVTSCRRACSTSSTVSALKLAKPLATSPRIAKIAFTGETSTGRTDHAICQPRTSFRSTAGAGRQVAEHLLRRRHAAKTMTISTRPLEGFAMFAFFNQGEVCTCPSRALVHEKIYDRFMEKALKQCRCHQAVAIRWTLSTMIGAQASSEQLEKILSYMDIGRQEGAEVLIGGEREQPRRRAGRRLLRQADGVQGPQQDARVPGRNFWAGRIRHDLQG